MDSEGNILQQITDDVSEEWGPIWINDQEISYLSQSGNSISIIRYNLESKQKAVIPHPDNCLIDDKNILHSPAGFQQMYSCKGEIYVVDQILEKKEQVTAAISGVANYPSWINENEILFTSNHDGDNDIYRLNLLTDQLDNLTNSKSNDERADLSPDGKLLLYSSDRFDKGNQDIVIQNIDTNEITRVTASKATELIARWSKHQKRVYFGSNKDGNWEIYGYKLKQRTVKRLTKNDQFDGDPRIR
ncbi:MAG: hypothetical protein AAFQ94_22370 [Bacteroidota bacterium]